MIILGGFPDGVVFGPHGITPAQIGTAGNADSPLLNDIDPGDDATELLWVLLPPLVATGTVIVNDRGGFALESPAVGIWTQQYRLLALPASGPPVVGEASIVVSVGAVVPPVFGPAVSSWTVRSIQRRIGTLTITKA